MSQRSLLIKYNNRNSEFLTADTLTAVTCSPRVENVLSFNLCHVAKRPYILPRYVPVVIALLRSGVPGYCANLLLLPYTQ